jgi:hypothetical protein
MNLELLQVRMVINLSVSSQTRFSGIGARIGVHLSWWFRSIGSFEILLHVIIELKLACRWLISTLLYNVYSRGMLTLDPSSLWYLS